MKKLLRLTFGFVRELIWIFFSIGLVYGGYLGFQYLGANKSIVEIASVQRPIASVETQVLESFDNPIPVQAEGFIRPFRRVSLTPTIGGRVTQLHSSILNLGTFSTGDVLVQLEDSNERAFLNQTIANVDGTRARLDLVKTQLERTQTLRQRGVASQQTLDQLLSQEAELVANLNALIAAQEAARIALESKRILAPFDGAVLEKVLEVGSVVGAGQTIAEIYTNQRMEVLIPVREADAALIPGLLGSETAQARVEVDFAGIAFQWPASVTRVSPALDPLTRTLSVTIELEDIDQPFLRSKSLVNNVKPPALINAFAKVSIDGVVLEDVYAVPSSAIRGGDQIWIFNPIEDGEGSLQIVDLQTTHIAGETTYVTISNQPDGTQFIKTTLAAPTEGMPLRNLSSQAMAQMGLE